MGNARTGRSIDAALRRKGFRRVMDGKHIQYFFQTVDGHDSTIMTFVSHGMMGISIGSPLIAQMARQLHLTKAQFLALIDCPLDEEGYRTILCGQGFDV